MSLTLHYHPLSSYCQKVLVAFYENGTPFTPNIVNLGDAAERAAFLKLWPIGKFPVVRDSARNLAVPESSPIIEYLGRHYPGRVRLVPDDAELAWQARFQDRFFDLHIHDHMQKIVGDRLRPAESRDPFGVEQAKTKLRTAYDVIDQEMAKKTWAAGDAFTIADCAAAPALFYANLALPFEAHPNVTAYYQRLMERPSFKRVVEEAKPYFHLFPR